jgi:hypothetical protein
MGLSAPKGEWAGAGGNMKPETIRLLLVAGKDAPLPVLPMEGEEGDQPAFDAVRPRRRDPFLPHSPLAPCAMVGVPYASVFRGLARTVWSLTARAAASIPFPVRDVPWRWTLLR